MSEPYEDSDPLSQFMAVMEQRAEREKTIIDRAELERDKFLQRIRVLLTAMVDDPTHPFTEGDYAKAFCSYVKVQDAIGEHISNAGDKSVSTIMRITAERLLSSANHLDSFKCDCPACTKEESP